MAVTATRHDDGGQCPGFSQLAKLVREANLLVMAGRSGRKSAVEVTNVGKFGIIAVPADLPYAFAVCDYLLNELGILAAPGSAFFRKGDRRQYVRFSFARTQQTIATAAGRLRASSARPE